ncbi:SlyX family protein [Psychromonas sp. 14N.309.X.WAT.B.A12]|uniref:SlyX family protein n=1 Tax=unclassified Psychromonas TaxID=2614957 RepID=UPI0025B0BE26|nr:SlyX family protein [Psychromonas sp. 14N.309.X.WAT.B.A12]MDN2663339.1 SlyX family protein [Psychromonas sp. 14N.309.X.WAT.B.A12]
MTNKQSELEERIEQLEMKVAFQEDNIDTLNQEIFEQQRRTQQLIEQVALLAVKLKESQPNQLASEKEEMRPPHY